MLIINPGVNVCYNNGYLGTIIRRVICDGEMLYDIRNLANNKVESVPGHHIDMVEVYETDATSNWMMYDILKDEIACIDVDTRISFDAYKNLKKLKNNYIKRNSGRYPWGNASGVRIDGKHYKTTGLPVPKKVIFSGDCTIVIWCDNTKTIVRRTEDDTDDREKAIMYAIFKKTFNRKSDMNKYLSLFEQTRR